MEHLCQSCVDSHDKVHIIGTLIGMPNSWPNYLNESILYINYVSLNIWRPLLSWKRKFWLQNHYTCPIWKPSKMLYCYIKQVQMPHSRTYHHCLLQAAAVLTRQVIWLLVWFKQNVLPLFYLFSWQYPCSQLIACVEGEAHNIFSDIQNLLTTHRSELTHFTQELREVSYNLCWFHISLQIFEHFNNDHKSYLEFAPAVL